jgi:hypothetical protein
LTPGRRILLRIVMMHLSSGGSYPASLGELSSRRSLLSGSVGAVYIVVIIAVAALAAVIAHLSLL